MVQYLQFKNSESGHYLVKCKSESYNFQSCQNLGKYFIRAGELLCYAVYFNPLDNVKQ